MLKNFGIGFEVDDMDKAYKEMKSKGVNFEDAPAFNPRNGRTLADTRDADGCFWI